MDEVLKSIIENIKKQVTALEVLTSEATKAYLEAEKTGNDDIADILSDKSDILTSFYFELILIVQEMEEWSQGRVSDEERLN